MALWPLFLKDKCDFLTAFCTFMEKKKESGKLNVVPKDTWNMLWEFIKECKNGKLSGAPEQDGSWPTLIEEFCIEQGVWKEEEY